METIVIKIGKLISFMLKKKKKKLGQMRATQDPLPIAGLKKNFLNGEW